MNEDTYRRWLEAQHDRDDPIGDLSTDVLGDPLLKGRELTPESLYEYLSRRGASHAVLNAAKEAALEYGVEIEH